MLGWQAAGSAPLVLGEPVLHPETIATAIRIGNPASWEGAIAARDESGGHIGAVTDAQILDAYRFLASEEGCFVEPASAASVAGLLQAAADGLSSARRRRGLHRHRPRAEGSGSGRSPRCRWATRSTPTVDDGRGRAGPRRHDAPRSSPARRPASDAPSSTRSPRRGDDVVLVARDGAPARRARGRDPRTAHGVDATRCVADLLDAAGSAAVEARLPTRPTPIDLLVNNAGIGTFGRFAELDVDREDARDPPQRARAACG